MRYYYGKDYLEKAKPVLDLIHDKGRDVNFVIDDPDYPMLLEDLAFLKDYPIGELRVSMAKELNIDDELRGKFIVKWKQVIDLLYGTEAKNRISLDKYRSENNITRYCTGKEMQCDMSMFCGSGMFYLCIDTDGKIYPCDYFAQFPEFQIGDIYNGITEPNRVFKQEPQWYKKIYEHCYECPLEDIRLCLNPPCLGENFRVNGDMFKPSKSVCQVKVIEFETIKYLVENYGCLDGHGNSCNKFETIGDK
jgi:radical SAM protein with 4Fe4S-binding SPASM domain